MLGYVITFAIGAVLSPVIMLRIARRMDKTSARRSRVSPGYADLHEGLQAATDALRALGGQAANAALTQRANAAADRAQAILDGNIPPHKDPEMTDV